MSNLDPRVIDAQNNVEAQRAKLMRSVSHAIGEAQRRLAPDLLAEQAWEKTKEKGAQMAEDAVDLAKRKPWLVGGLVAGLTLFLARKPVGRAAVETYDRLAKRAHEAEKADDALEKEAPNSPVAVARRAKRVAPKKKQKKSEVEKQV